MDLDEATIEAMAEKSKAMAQEAMEFADGLGKGNVVGLTLALLSCAHSAGIAAAVMAEGGGTIDAALATRIIGHQAGELGAGAYATMLDMVEA